MNIDTIFESFFVSVSIPKNFTITEEDFLDNKVTIQENIATAMLPLENRRSIISISSSSPLIASIIQS